MSSWCLGWRLQGVEFQTPWAQSLLQNLNSCWWRAETWCREFENLEWSGQPEKSISSSIAFLQLQNDCLEGEISAAGWSLWWWIFCWNWNEKDCWWSSQNFHPRDICACGAFYDLGFHFAETTCDWKEGLFARYAHEQLCFNAWSASASEWSWFHWKSRKIHLVPMCGFQWMVAYWILSMEGCGQTPRLHLWYHWWKRLEGLPMFGTSALWCCQKCSLTQINESLSFQWFFW